MTNVQENLERLGIILPAAAAPVANYVPFVRSGPHLYVSGQVSIDAQGGIKGKLGGDLDMETGQKAARLCGINLLAQLLRACEGDWSRLVRVVKLGAFVNCVPDFAPIPLVANGCSDLMVEVLGDRGRHARSAVGSSNLPLDFAVEVDGVFELRS